MQTVSPSVSFEYQKPIQQHYTAGVYMSNNLSSQSPSTSPTLVPGTGLASSASTVAAPSSTDGTQRGKSKAVKPSNVFSNDGSFLDRIRRSKKEEEDRKKEKEALDRKKQFADRFKTRGKRPPPPNSSPSTSDTTPDCDESPKKKIKIEEVKDDGSAQAQYHKAMESYPGSLKDDGTGVRPLVK